MKVFKYICHQRPDRSFFVRGHQFPLCSRCTGFVVGSVLYVVYSLLCPVFYSYGLLVVGVVSQIPYIVDGTTQFLGLRESNNVLRFVTGFVGGVGLVILARFTRIFLGHLLCF